MTTPANPLDRLTHLASVRTARTDQLHARTAELFRALRGLVPIGSVARVGGVEVSLHRTRTNVGSDVHWSVCVGGEDGEFCSDLELPVGREGFLHGDFNHPCSGPTRGILVAVGRCAAELVSALAGQAEGHVAELESALVGCESAARQVGQ